jgi:hypothetical protein
MSVGKPPHRGEGKARMDNEHMSGIWHEKGMPYAGGPSDKEVHETDMENKERMGQPTRHPAEEQVGGSRPGVESRVKEAIARREDREAEE